MVSRCANPECSAKFRYLSRGKLFHLHKKEEGSPCKDRVESFWLCAACAAHVALVAKPDGTVAIHEITDSRWPGRVARPVVAVA
jgi:hypothetical protein